MSAEYELGGLERAAAAAGFDGLTARVVPPQKRRARWFVVAGSELLVNERVLERLRPEEGAALCTTELLRQRVLRPWRLGLPLAALALVAGAAFVGGGLLAPGAALLLALLVAPALYGLASQRADEQAIATVGNPDLVVRSMNVMNQDRLDVGGKQLDSRPDIHARAERLVERYELRLEPGQRSAAARALPGAAGSTGSCVETGCAAPQGASAPADEAGAPTPRG